MALSSTDCSYGMDRGLPSRKISPCSLWRLPQILTLSRDSKTRIWIFFHCVAGQGPSVSPMTSPLYSLFLLTQKLFIGAISMSLSRYGLRIRMRQNMNWQFCKPFPTALLKGNPTLSICWTFSSTVAPMECIVVWSLT